MTKSAMLSIQIAAGDARPIFRQIVDAVRMQIACGNLAVGAKLPSVRGLALQLMINANTVAKAYTELTNQGLVEARQGLGLFVAQPKQMLSREQQQKILTTAIDTFVNDVAYLDYTDEDVLDQVAQALGQLASTQKVQGV